MKQSVFIPYSWITYLIALVLTLNFVGGIWFYQTQKNAIQQKAKENLQTLTELKITQIAEWREDQLHDGEAINNNRFLFNAIQQFLDNGSEEHRKTLLSHLELLADQHDYSNILLADSVGNIVFSLTGQHVEDEKFRTCTVEVMRTRKTMLSELHHATQANTPHLACVVPIFAGPNQSGSIIGELGFITNASQFLYPRIAFWPTASNTAETLLVVKEKNQALLVNNTKLSPHAAFQLHLPIAENSMLALLGGFTQDTFYHGDDYRNHQVIASILPVPDSSWYVVSKIDVTEVFAEWKHQSFLMLTVILMLPLLVSIAGMYISQNRKRRFYKALYLEEAELRQNGDRYKIILQAIGDAVIVTNAHGKVELLNPVAEELTGWSNSEARNCFLEDIALIIEETMNQPAKNLIQDIINRSSSEHFKDQAIFIAKDNRQRPVTISGARILGSDDIVTGIVLVLRDKSAEQLAQSALKNSERRFRATFEQAVVGMAHVGLDGSWLRVNKKFCEIFGYPSHELLTRSFETLISPHQPESDEAYHNVLLHNRLIGGEISHYSNEREYIRKDQTVIWANLTVSLVYGPTNIPEYFNVVIEDISPKKNVENALQESEERLRLALDATSEALWDWDMTNGNVYRSSTYYQLVERPESEDTHDFAFFKSVVHPDDFPHVLYTIEQHKLAHTPRISFDFRLNSPDKVKWLRVRGKAVQRDEYGMPLRIVGTLADITTYIQNMEALEKSRAELDAALASMTDAVLISDATGTFLEFNEAFAAFHRFKCKAECLKTNQEFTDILEIFLENGTLAPLEMWAVPRALRGENANNAIYYLHRRDTDESWVGSYSFSPIRDQNDRIVGSVVVARDITELKKTEEEKADLEKRLQQVQKMEAVGQLAGGVAHDFNNMLSVILGHTELAMEEIDPAHQVMTDLNIIKEAAYRSADIIRQLLAFARKQTITPRVLNFNESVDQSLKMLRRLIGEDIELEWYSEPGLWQVRMDPTQIDQLLTNLCVNARDAISGTGTITIETKNASIDSEYCRAHPDSTAGDYVMLAVTDTGTGMTREIQQRIFEPFFTTKKLGEGTGLGLATVFGIVKQNSGFLNLYSKPGEGTVFRLYFPKYDDAGLLQNNDETIVADGGNDRILLVEDEPQFLETTTRILTRYGYTVMAADSPDEAINLVKTFDGKIDLLLTDVIMPEMNGWELAQRLLKDQPHMQCLFMSGYTADIITKQGLLMEGIQFIQKPFSKLSLAAKIREVLNH